MSFKRIRKAAKRVGGKIQDKAKAYGRAAAPFAKKIFLAPFGAVGSALGGMFGAGGGGGGNDSGSDYRSMAAKKIRETSKQAGAAQIKFNEEYYE